MHKVLQERRPGDMLSGMRSTLSPGRVPRAIVALRDAARREADAPEPGTYKVRGLKFDQSTGWSRPAKFNQDDNTIARFPGLISPHVGNGRGVPK